MAYRKTTVQFVSIAEARAHFVRQGYVTIDDGAVNTATMSKVVDGVEVGTVSIHRDAPFTIIAEKLEKSTHATE